MTGSRLSAARRRRAYPFPADAEIIFVGEQPGDREDRESRPVIGPAGQWKRIAQASFVNDPIERLIDSPTGEAASGVRAGE